MIKLWRFLEDAGIFDGTIEFSKGQETLLARSYYYNIAVIGRTHSLFEWLCHGAIYLHTFLKSEKVKVYSLYTVRIITNSSLL